jgi:hypothetical protein
MAVTVTRIDTKTFRLTNISIHKSFMGVFKMKSKIGIMAALLGVSLPAALMIGCVTNEYGSQENGPQKSKSKHLLFVAHLGSLTSYDIATGEQQAGEIADVTDPNGMQALQNGVLLVNLTGRNEVLVVNGKDMSPIKRIPCTLPGRTAVRPIHSFITPKYNGKQYWMALNDGAATGNTAAANSALFIDISTPSDTASIKAVGEIGIGIGHHVACFSKTQHRAVISNIGDTAKVLGVYDYSNPAQVTELKAWSASSLGIKGSASPHGCGTSKLNGHGYCNASGPGHIISVDIDASTPTVRVLKTKGSGGGFTLPHPEGRYVYSVQASPREGDTTWPGAVCQVGQIVVIDAQSDSVVNEVAVKYDGPDCARSIVGTVAATASPGYITFSGNKMYVQLGTARADTNSSAAKHMVLDITNPANPVQKASLDIGKSYRHHGEAISGDKKVFFVANNLDGTVSQINAAAGTVTKTLTVRANPSTVATWGEEEGPSQASGPLE